MTLEEKLNKVKVSTLEISLSSMVIQYVLLEDALSICQEAVDEAKVNELQTLWNELPLMSDLTTVSERIYKRIEELKEKL